MQPLDLTIKGGALFAAWDTGPTGCILAARGDRTGVQIEPYEAAGANRVPGMVERVVYNGASEQLVIRLATGTVVQALSVRDGTPEKWTQGTAVQAYLPAEALRVLPPSPTGSAAPATPEEAPEADEAIEVGAG